LKPSRAGDDPLPNPLFARKLLAMLVEEARGEQRLRRVLGPWTLTALGVGAIVGTGIFILTGVAAHDKTGPALILSFMVAGLAGVLAALCYAEFTSMAPVAGSAHTCAYATLGELPAWIIGWDLVLEYTVAAAAVAQVGRRTSAICCTASA
jgi:APA family basic amino acid/polyamine antiporter